MLIKVEHNGKSIMISSRLSIHKKLGDLEFIATNRNAEYTEDYK